MKKILNNVKKQRKRRRQTMLENIDLSKTIEKSEYQKQLAKSQARLRKLFQLTWEKKIPVIVLYEGWDASGKGGNIKRLTQKLDPRGYTVVPVSKPSKEEYAHHYLWRFWRSIPPKGKWTIFDRSWYGRVMVERVEGFATEDQWMRAYQEINEFESQLTRFGVVLFKFFIHIDRDEQLRRFKERQNNPYKHWKITDEDWRNREKWPEYQKAIEEMFRKTSTIRAPWLIIEGNSKWVARLKTLQLVTERLAKVLDVKLD